MQSMLLFLLCAVNYYRRNIFYAYLEGNTDVAKREGRYTFGATVTCLWDTFDWLCQSSLQAVKVGEFHKVRHYYL